MHSYEGLISAAYVVAAILFILALGGLSGQEKAKRAIWYGIIGMVLAVVATVGAAGGQWVLMGIMIALGGVGGWSIANRVQMTQMPELMAGFHSLVGLAAVFIGINAHLELTVARAAIDSATVSELAGFAATIAAKSSVEISILKVEMVLSLFIGAITFTGSLIAYGKLAERLSSAPLTLPGRHILNLAAILLCVWLGYLYLVGGGLWTLILITLIAGALGCHLILGIGGADMPVVVSMLNSYSGWAAAAIGFTLSNDLLIVTGALVGSSGAILSYLMCKGMNRSFVSVILGGWGGESESSASISGEMREADVDSVAQELDDADSVVIVPGYGMAVAKAQGAVSELSKRLRAKGKTVRFAIHPVAGRLPGHMNVLLAEAKVPYDFVLEMEELNHDFPQTDVVIVIGANDIVNPSAQDDPGSPIAGMPVLEVWKARTVFVCKRGRGTGYSGIENPLFFKENTQMFYGDAKASIDSLLQKIS